jgi:DNA-binding winged helix-turn-helix (wHTH) protein/tetratricopeptide (TPR) repeat protein
MAQILRFAEFRLDREAGVLLRKDEPIAIRRKVWDALCLLTEQPGALVSLDALRDRVWRGVLVADGSVSNLIYELRRTLDDSAAEPRYIETIPARGFRFLVPVESVEGDTGRNLFVGRDAELGRLDAAWARSLRGERQLVLVSGEPGIGKSHLIRHFVDRLVDRAAVPPRVLIGGCFASEDGAEAFLPVFDMLDAWRHSEDPARPSALAELLRSEAPRWARQIAWVDGSDTANALYATEARPERVRREIAAVFDTAATQRPLVLVFEDLHWADQATIGLLQHLATRTARASLLVIASFRPTDAAAVDSPVVRLQAAPRERLSLLSLQPLGRDDVRSCLGHVFADAPDVVAHLLDETMQRSGGNPLLVLALAQLAIDQSLVTRAASGWRIGHGRSSRGVAPAAVTTLLDEQLEKLAAADRSLLEAAAVAGEEMDAAAVAGCLGLDVEAVDTEMRRLSLHASLVHEVGVSTWPDGTAAGRFRFRHGLYREVLYRSLPAARRAKLHRRVGTAIELGHAAELAGVVALLAQHFEAGGDHRRAAGYLERAALQMIDRSALHEAEDYFRRALGHVVLLPDSDGRVAREVRVRTGYGLTAALTEGLETPAIRENHEAVDRLRHRVTDPALLFPTLRVFWLFELLRFGYAAMRTLNEQLQAVADASGNDAWRSLAASMTGTTHCFLGELHPAREFLERSLELCDDPRQLPPPQGWLADPRVETRCVLAWASWLSGEFARSREVLAEAQRIAAAGSHESTRGLVIWFRSSLAQLDGDIAATRAAADELQALAAESDLPAWLQIAALVRALADLTEGDPTGLEHGLASLAQSEGNPSVLIARAYLLGQLALAYGRRGEADKGLALVDVALGRIAANGARVSESDLRRIRGELLAGAGKVQEADDAFAEAIDIARLQGARAFELRAATARVHLLSRRRSRRLTAARAELARVCATFSESIEVHDLRAAREVLAGEASARSRPPA